MVRWVLIIEHLTMHWRGFIMRRGQRKVGNYNKNTSINLLASINRKLADLKRNIDVMK